MISPLSKIKSKDDSRPLRESDLPKLHDTLMKEYGWIPLKEFRELPLSTFWALYDIIAKRRQKEKEEYDKNNKKSKTKR